MMRLALELYEPALAGFGRRFAAINFLPFCIGSFVPSSIVIMAFSIERRGGARSGHDGRQTARAHRPEVVQAARSDRLADLLASGAVWFVIAVIWIYFSGLGCMSCYAAPE